MKQIRPEHTDIITIVPAQSVECTIPHITIAILKDTVNGVYRQLLLRWNISHCYMLRMQGKNKEYENEHK